MTKDEANRDVSVWNTKLTAKEVSNDNPGFILNRKSTWVVTEHARTLNGDILFVVQPLENPSGMGEGVSGMWALALTEDEFCEHFDIKG